MLCLLLQYELAEYMKRRVNGIYYNCNEDRRDYLLVSENTDGHTMLNVTEYIKNHLV